MQIRRQPGVIESFAELFGAAAGAHVEAVSDEPGLQRMPGHAAHVAGIAAAFEAVQQHHFADGIAGGALVCTRTCVSGSVRMRRRFNGIAREIVLPRPEVAEDGQEVRIAEKRLEGPHSAQASILAKTGVPAQRTT